MSDTTLPSAVQAADRVARIVSFRGGGFAPTPRRWVGFAVFAVLIAIAEWGTRSGWISALTLPRPSDVLVAFRELHVSGLLYEHLAISLSRLAVGAALGVSAGIGTGILIGLFSYIRAGLVPLVAAVFPIPKIALLPLFVIWFGIDEGSKYALIALGTFTPMVVATYGAVDNVDRTLIRMAQSFGLSWLSHRAKDRAAGRHARNPVRASNQPGHRNHPAGRGGDARGGVRHRRLRSWKRARSTILDRLFAGVVVLSLLGVLVSATITLLERRLLGWRT